MDDLDRALRALKAELYAPGTPEQEARMAAFLADLTQSALPIHRGGAVGRIQPAATYS